MGRVTGRVNLGSTGPVAFFRTSRNQTGMGFKGGSMFSSGYRYYITMRRTQLEKLSLASIKCLSGEAMCDVF